MSVTLEFSINPLHSGTLNDITSNLTGVMVSGSLEMLQMYNTERKHLLVITQFIRYSIH